MNYKFLLAYLACSSLFMQLSSLEAQTTPVFDVEQAKQEITIRLAQELVGQPHEVPILILVGGYPGAGKTTLIKALSSEHDIAVISWNAIRQAQIDMQIRGSPFDGEILDAVHENLLEIALRRHLNLVIDANAHARNIKNAEAFLKTEQDGAYYKVVKICLNPPLETLFKRLRAREQQEGIHQGTESDLVRDLNSSGKKIDLNEYALVINSEEVDFETEWEIVNSFLKPYLANQNESSPVFSSQN